MEARRPSLLDLPGPELVRVVELLDIDDRGALACACRPLAEVVRARWRTLWLDPRAASAPPPGLAGWRGARAVVWAPTRAAAAAALAEEDWEPEGSYDDARVADDWVALTPAQEARLRAVGDLLAAAADAPGGARGARRRAPLRLVVACGGAKGAREFGALLRAAAGEARADRAARALGTLVSSLSNSPFNPLLGVAPGNGATAAADLAAGIAELRAALAADAAAPPEEEEEDEGGGGGGRGDVEAAPPPARAAAAAADGEVAKPPDSDDDAGGALRAPAPAPAPPHQPAAKLLISAMRALSGPVLSSILLSRNARGAAVAAALPALRELAAAAGAGAAARGARPPRPGLRWAAVDAGALVPAPRAAGVARAVARATVPWCGHAPAEEFAFGAYGYAALRALRISSAFVFISYFIPTLLRRPTNSPHLSCHPPTSRLRSQQLRPRGGLPGRRLLLRPRARTRAGRPPHAARAPPRTPARRARRAAPAARGAPPPGAHAPRPQPARRAVLLRAADPPARPLRAAHRPVRVRGGRAGAPPGPCRALLPEAPALARRRHLARARAAGPRGADAPHRAAPRAL